MYSQWVGMTGQPSFQIYLMARQGVLEDVAHDPGFQATMRVMETLGLGCIEFNPHTAQPVEEQFWEQFDGVYQLTEQEMRKELNNFITDPNNQAKVEALLAGRDGESAEETARLA